MILRTITTADSQSFYSNTCTEVTEHVTACGEFRLCSPSGNFQRLATQMLGLREVLVNERSPGGATTRIVAVYSESLKDPN